MKTTHRAIDATIINRFITCLPHPQHVNGLLLIVPCNLPQATTDPENVTAPMKIPIKVSKVSSNVNSLVYKYFAYPTIVAAIPTKLCSKATI